jgi:hypothetical protein
MVPPTNADMAKPAEAASTTSARLRYVPLNEAKPALSAPIDAVTPSKGCPHTIPRNKVTATPMVLRTAVGIEIFDRSICLAVRAACPRTLPTQEISCRLCERPEFRSPRNFLDCGECGRSRAHVVGAFTGITPGTGTDHLPGGVGSMDESIPGSGLDLGWMVSNWGQPHTPRTRLLGSYGVVELLGPDRPVAIGSRRDGGCRQACGGSEP